jgi:hypothetical protein
MEARLKGLHSPDVSDLESWKPNDPVSWGFLLQALVGRADDKGEESFEIIVCTPSWFATNLLTEGLRSGEHTLFMNRYDFRVLKSYLERRIHAATGDTWSEIASKLAGLGTQSLQPISPDHRTKAIRLPARNCDGSMIR